MLEDDGLGFADFLASVQEKGETMEGKNIKLSNISFNGKLWATVNEHWHAFYDGEKLETDAPVNEKDLEFLLKEKFNSCIPHPLVDALQKMNSNCEHDESVGVLVTDDYVFEQVQEGDCAGWTLVYRGREIIAYMNWQACGCCVETYDDKFYDFLRGITKKGFVYAGLDDPNKIDIFMYGEEFWATVGKILRLKSGWLSVGNKIEYFDTYLEKPEIH